MSRRKIQLRVPPESSGARLDQFLSQQLSLSLSQPLSKSKVRALIVAGAVYLNGRRVRIASKAVLNGARVEVYVDLSRVQEGRSARTPFVLTEEAVLYRDSWMIAVSKPPGLPTQPTVDEARANLFASLKRFLQREAGPEVYVGLHHRLDRDTSGVILFATDVRANAGLARAFQEHLARKTYFALVGKTRSGQLAQEWEVSNFLGKISRSGPSRFGAVRSGGDLARTHFACHEQNDRVAWIQARPETGRTHQIRVHLAEDGLPILGDATYGALCRDLGAELEIPRLMLHAARIELPHPVTGKPLSIEAPLPSDMKSALKRAAVKVFPSRSGQE